MFNPQRKSKLADIYMDERNFHLHLDKISKIRGSVGPFSNRQAEEQERYLKRLRESKQEVKERLTNQVAQENHRLFLKLMETGARPEDNPELPPKRRHHNSHFSGKQQAERIRNDNCGIITRMLNQTAVVPSVVKMKRDFKQSRRYEKLVRKLPAILKHEKTMRRDFSMHRIAYAASRRQLSSDRASTQMMTHQIEDMENTLVHND